MMTSDAFTKLYEIIRTLRGPEGCPWDRKQTLETLIPHLVEEAYELMEGIYEKDPENIREELGDVFLVALMIGHVFEESSSPAPHESSASSSVRDVFRGASEKLIRRHPHVFRKDRKLESVDAVLKQWDQIKQEENQKSSGKTAKKRRESLLDSIPSTLPPFDRTCRLLKKSLKFNSDNPPVFPEEEEASRLSPAQKENPGRVLFSLIALLLSRGQDPSAVLRERNKEFTRRFQEKEKALSRAPHSPEPADPVIRKQFEKEKEKGANK